MKSSWLKCLLGAGFLAVAATAAHAQELRIGYVNSDIVMRDSLPAKVALQKLHGEFSKREKEVNDLASRLKATGDRFEREQMTLGETERVRRQRELIEQDREFQRKRRQFQEDLSQRRSEELASVSELAEKVIRQMADKEGYDLILSDAQFASARINITDKVIKALNNAQGGK